MQDFYVVTSFISPLIFSFDWIGDCDVKVLAMVRFPLMDAGLLSDVIKDHEVTKVRLGVGVAVRQGGWNWDWGLGLGPGLSQWGLHVLAFDDILS